MVAINHKLYDIYPTKNRFSHSSSTLEQANAEYIKKEKKNTPEEDDHNSYLYICILQGRIISRVFQDI